MTDEPYNAGDRADVREADKLSRIAQRQDLDVTRDIMRTTAGRAWMHRKLTACHIYQTTATPGDAFATYFNEGQRNIGLMLNAEILTACPDEFILMLKEANERDLTHDTTRRNRKAGNGNGIDTSGGNFVNYNEPVGDGDEAVEREH